MPPLEVELLTAEPEPATGPVEFGAAAPAASNKRPRAVRHVTPAERGAPVVAPLSSDAATVQRSPSPTLVVPNVLALRPPPPPAGGGGLDDVYQPTPNVVHHPVTPNVVGTHRTPAGVEARVQPDGSIRFRDPPPVSAHAGGLAFDLNDFVFRAAGVDPYSTQKARLADETREDRICLANEDRLQRKKLALHELRRRLDDVVQPEGGSALSWHERRTLVFELWDDCTEGGTDAERALAASYRATIVAYVRRVFPPGSPQAFTPQELIALNQRRSAREPFDPYGKPSGERDAGAPPS